MSPPNDETPSVRGKGFQDTNKNADARIIPFVQKDGNSTATLIARLGLAGHTVHRGSEHDFTVVKADWGMSRYCADYAALVAFGQILGVRP